MNRAVYHKDSVVPFVHLTPLFLDEIHHLLRPTRLREQGGRYPEAGFGLEVRAVQPRVKLYYKKYLKAKYLILFQIPYCKKF